MTSSFLIMLFIFGCAGSSLLCGHFSSCGKQGLLFSCSVRASRCNGFSCCRARVLGHSGFSSCSSQFLEHRLGSCGALGLVALQHVGSSQIRDRTRFSCIGRQILHHWEPPGKPLYITFLNDDNLS